MNADKRAKSVFSEPEPRQRTGDVSPRASSAQPRAVGLRGRFLRGGQEEAFPFSRGWCPSRKEGLQSRRLRPCGDELVERCEWHPFEFLVPILKNKIL